MTLDVYRGRKTTMQQYNIKKRFHYQNFQNDIHFYYYFYLFFFTKWNYFYDFLFASPDEDKAIQFWGLPWKK